MSSNCTPLHSMVQNLVITIHSAWFSIYLLDKGNCFFVAFICLFVCLSVCLSVCFSICLAATLLKCYEQIVVIFYGADDPTLLIITLAGTRPIIEVSVHQHWWLAGGYDLDLGHY